MKAFFLLTILSLNAFAMGPRETRMSDQEVSQKLVSVARDIENERMLGAVQQLQQCKDRFPFDPSTTPTPAQFQALQTCVQQQVGNSPEQIAQISDQLKLETFRLIPSKTVNNVTEYLTKKLYKNMTGVDLDQRSIEDRIEAMKFKNKKQLDQQQFFELYKNQMSKNVIYEISRFCFEDFRNKTTSAPNAPSGPNSSFIDNWANLAAFTTSDPQGLSVDDSGTPSFRVADQTTGVNAQGSYQGILEKIVGTGSSAGTLDSTKLSNFFQFCAKQIDVLCKAYENSCAKSSTDLGTTSCASSGSRACLAKNRIIAARRALSASREIWEEFTKDNNTNVTIALDPRQVVKRYSGGTQDRSEKTFNDLTNTASADFFKGSENDNNQAAEDCIRAGGDGSSCDAFTIVDDSAARIQYSTNLEYTAKRTAEIERIKALVSGNRQTLLEYLENNYPDLKKPYEDGTINLEEAVAQRWDGQRQAMLQEITAKIKPRQISETEIAADQDLQKNTAVANATVALNEKARLAQVVLFNNIISSSLELKFESGASAGRNVQTLANEIDTAENEFQVSNFANLRASLVDSGSSGGSSSGGTGQTITDISFLYELIGIPKAEEGQ